MTDTPNPIPIPGADLAELIAAAEECAGDLEAEIDGKYPNPDSHPIETRRYNRDMAPVIRLRAALAKLKGE